MNKNFTKVLNHEMDLMADLGISPVAYKLAIIGMRFREADRNRWPRMPYLQKQMGGCSERTIRRCLKELNDAGLIEQFGLALRLDRVKIKTPAFDRILDRWPKGRYKSHPAALVAFRKACQRHGLIDVVDGCERFLESREFARRIAENPNFVPQLDHFLRDAEYTKTLDEWDLNTSATKAVGRRQSANVGERRRTSATDGNQAADKRRTKSEDSISFNDASNNTGLSRDKDGTIPKFPREQKCPYLRTDKSTKKDSTLYITKENSQRKTKDFGDGFLTKQPQDPVLAQRLRTLEQCSRSPQMICRYIHWQASRAIELLEKMPTLQAWGVA